MEEKTLKAKPFLAFILSPLGRTLRIVVGLAMIYFGFMSFTVLGAVISGIGFIPLLAGAFDICILGPLFGGYFRGDKMRALLHLQQGHPEHGTNAQSWIRA